MQYEPELGQAIFGNATGEYDCPNFVDAFLEHICREIERVYWNIHQKEWDGYSGVDPQIPGIEYRPYYWGDCTCGWDDKECPERHAPTCYQQDADLKYIRQVEYKIDRSLVPPKYKALCDKYGIPWNNGYGCAVHCTCDYCERFEAWFNENKLGKQGHADDCPIVLPNFKFQDAEIRWYKHRGRGQSVNVSWNEKQWRQWFDECLRHIRDYEEEICQRTPTP